MNKCNKATCIEDPGRAVCNTTVPSPSGRKKSCRTITATAPGVHSSPGQTRVFRAVFAPLLLAAFFPTIWVKGLNTLLKFFTSVSFYFIHGRKKISQNIKARSSIYTKSDKIIQIKTCSPLPGKHSTRSGRKWPYGSSFDKLQFSALGSALGARSALEPRTSRWTLLSYTSIIRQMGIGGSVARKNTTAVIFCREFSSFLHQYHRTGGHGWHSGKETRFTTCSNILSRVRTRHQCRA
ncbi:hypothetical protein PoB_005739400 [Plakobranchus ocellatus]|uniref:Uncharacterized protein n=1 Tax=Plakobranchus ocellatus TaxID=259542 RepID=A0AAV4CE19_9GAST|nr:hypothetical protein PoB_005739400 [Plakobranchus ocellatus]